MIKVIAHVISAERKHGKRITTYFTNFAKGSCRHLRSHGGSQIHTEVPVKGLVDQRDGSTSSAPENKSAYRHTVRIIPILVNHRILVSGRGETRVGMGCGFSTGGIILLAMPVDKIRWYLFGHSFPPHIAIRHHSNIRKDGVPCDRLHGVWIGFPIRTWRHTEISGFRIDGMQLSIFTWLYPGNIITNRCDLPPFELVWRN